MGILSIVLGTFASIIAAIVIRGWILVTLWGWFIVTTFNMPELTIPQALGITTIIGLLTAHLQQDSDTKININASKKSTADMVGTIAAKMFGGPLVTLLVGWIITWFM